MNLLSMFMIKFKTIIFSFKETSHIHHAICKKSYKIKPFIKEINLLSLLNLTIKDLSNLIVKTMLNL